MPVEDLAATDLETFPVWEFAWDEDATEAQDETWVRPVDSSVISQQAGSVCAGAVVRLRNGLVYPAVAFGEGGGSFYIEGLALLTVAGRVLFHMGDPPEDVSSALRHLGLKRADVFPLEYSTLAPLESTGEPASGTFGARFAG